MKTTHRTDRSVATALLQTSIKPLRPHLGSSSKIHPKGSLRLTLHSFVHKHCHIVERQVHGLWVYDISCSKDGSSQSSDKEPNEVKASHDSPPPQTQRIYYICGGSWTQPPSAVHWKFCAKLARLLPHSIVSVISHPLAPKMAAPEAFPIMIGAYAELMEQSAAAGEVVTWGGDSSGGNIVLAVVLDVLSRGGRRGAEKGLDGAEVDGMADAVRAPEKLLLISPTMDMRPMKENDSGMVALAARKDPVLTIADHDASVASWCDTWPRTDPRLSPCFADYQVLNDRGVRVYGVTGTHDILAPAALLARDRMQEIGVEGEWLEWEGLMHCFPLSWNYGLKEAKEGLLWIVNVLKQ